MNKIKYSFTLLAFVLFLACDNGGDVTKPADNLGTAVQDMAGDWYVETYQGDNKVLGYERITTYNTADNVATEMWVNDNGNIWEFKTKANVDYGNLKFWGDDLPSDYDGYEITVTITDGQIVKDGATTSGGNTSDAISFNAEFSDDPGTVYTIKGYKRTGFLEDEH